MTPVAGSRERPRRQSPAPERRRGDLLDAAAALFASQGVEATSIAAIAEAAGVAKGSFYRYFASREELIAALKARYIEDFLEAVTAFSGRVGNEDWWVLADEFVVTMVDALLAQRDLIRVFFALPRTPESVALFAATEGRIDAVIAAGIEAGVAAGAYRVADPLATATLLQNAISSTVEHAIVHGREMEPERLIAAAQRLVRVALQGS